MAIYHLHNAEKQENFTEVFEEKKQAVSQAGRKGHLFSTIVTRFCFLLLLIADTLWFVWNAALLTLACTIYLITLGKKRPLLAKSALQTRRSLLCGLALFIGLFSPPFGIMVACTYFLMYDKTGMEEVVPAPLQAQFKEIFNQEP